MYLYCTDYKIFHSKCLFYDDIAHDCLLLYTIVTLYNHNTDHRYIQPCLLAFFLVTKVSKTPEAIVRWLGFGLIPQTGVAVGLALTLSQMPAFQEISSLIVNVVLATTLLYEILGSLALRFSINRAGELGINRKKSKI